MKNIVVSKRTRDLIVSQALHHLDESDTIILSNGTYSFPVSEDVVELINKFRHEKESDDETLYRILFQKIYGTQ